MSYSKNNLKLKVVVFLLITALIFWLVPSNIIFGEGEDQGEEGGTVIEESSNESSNTVTALVITSPTTAFPASVLPGGTVTITYQITASQLDQVVDRHVSILTSPETTVNPAVISTPLSALIFTVTTTVTIPAGTATGTYDVRVRARQPATGAWQKEATNTGAVIVSSPSVEALSITAPSDINVEGNTEGGATVSLGTPTVSGGTPPYDVTNDAPSTFPLGTTVVTWTATDDDGNSASATQNVTVVDTTPPTITAPDDVTIEGNTIGGANITAADLGTAAATDLVDPSPTVTNDAPSFLSLGSHTVTWTATDDDGNSTSATQNVTVVDTTPPDIDVASTFSTTAGAPNSVLPAPTVTDIVDEGPIIATNDAPSFFPPGTTTVTWTATDASGNSATATTTVTATYLFGGILQPINANGSSIFKLGSTIPVKFLLTDYSGSFVTTAVATIKVAKVLEDIAGDDIEAISTNTPATTGNLFRLADSQYIFNLATKSLSTGTWQIRITLDDGTSQTVKISLK